MMKKIIEETISKWIRKEREPIKWTKDKYTVSLYGIVQWPIKILTPTDNNGYACVTVWYRDKNNKYTRKNELIQILVANTFPHLIENYDKKENYKNPRLTHKDDNRKNNEVSNLKRIDHDPTTNFSMLQDRGRWHTHNYHIEQKEVIETLTKDRTFWNKELAQIVFGDKYISQQHDQFIYRERKKLEIQNIIPISKVKIEESGPFAKV